MLVGNTTVTRAPVDASVLSMHVGPEEGSDPGIKLYLATKLNVAQSCDNNGVERTVAIVIMTVVEEIVEGGGGGEGGGNALVAGTALGGGRLGMGGGGGLTLGRGGGGRSGSNGSGGGERGGGRGGERRGGRGLGLGGGDCFTTTFGGGDLL